LASVWRVGSTRIPSWAARQTGLPACACLPAQLLRALSYLGPGRSWGLAACVVGTFVGGSPDRRSLSQRRFPSLADCSSSPSFHGVLLHRLTLRLSPPPMRTACSASGTPPGRMGVSFSGTRKTLSDSLVCGVDHGITEAAYHGTIRSTGTTCLQRLCCYDQRLHGSLKDWVSSSCQNRVHASSMSLLLMDMYLCMKSEHTEDISHVIVVLKNREKNGSDSGVCVCHRLVPMWRRLGWVEITVLRAARWSCRMP
jgi:hypothetical protein